MKGFVVDSFALLAYLEDEPGANKMERLFDEARNNRIELLMSVVNWGEVYYSIFRAKGEEKAEEYILIAEQLPLEIVEIDRDLMYQAARLKAVHRIALADCIAAALAMSRDYPVITGDPEFKRLEKKIKIEWLRRAG